SRWIRSIPVSSGPLAAGRPGGPENGIPSSSSGGISSGGSSKSASACWVPGGRGGGGGGAGRLVAGAGEPGPEPRGPEVAAATSPPATPLTVTFRPNPAAST